MPSTVIDIQNDIEALRELLSSPRKIIITTHHKPDADALGSSLALSGFLKKKGHHVQVITPTDYPRFLHWMHGNQDVIIFNEGNEAKTEEMLDDADMVFCLDFSALGRINEMGELIRKSPVHKVLIDHHLEPEPFADFTLWNPKASSTAELVYQLISKLEPENGLDLHISECIYAGILTDTGGFRHPTTSRNVHIVIADLLRYGVDASRIHKLIYDTSTESRIRFLGYVLEQKLVVLQEYHTAFIVISKEELDRFHSETGDTEGFVNYALSIEGIVMGAVIIDRTEAVKMSFRSVGDFSVNQFARNHFEGGGHKNAAGGKSDESIEETVARFVGLLPQYKNQLSAVATHYFESLK